MTLILEPRRTQSDADEFLDLISNPFQSQIQVNSIYASIIWAFAVSGGLFLLFVLLRPRNGRVYAPRAKHADNRHAPPPLAKTPFAWTKVVRNIDEHDLVERIGLDAVVFLRFLRMLRNLFIIFTVIGCGVLIPLNLVDGHSLYSQWSNIATLMKFTPQYIFGQKFWGYVVLAYILQLILFFLVWWNYRAVLALTKRYFNSHDYQLSLHARTILVTQIPREYQNDEGITEIVREARPTGDTPKTTVARNVGDLPHLILQHDKAVRQLEGYLAKYLANPNSIPATRPQCKIAKEDRRGHSEGKIDAIDYLQGRIRRLHLEIEEIRKNVDSRDTMDYGFASYTHIEDAHAVAYASRKKAPHGSTIRLAPKPHDLIWQNLPVSRVTRRTRQFWGGLWMVLLTIAYIPLNILSAVFLSDFSHLGLLWSDFNSNLRAHPVGWGIVQGILAPSFQYLIFLGLPTVFRRLYNHSGDISKTSREKHVMARLYVFFVVNNLIVFSIFGSAFRFLASVIEAQDQNVWDAIKHAHIFTNLMAGLCNVSTFWLTYQMQQNLGAAVDIAQLMPLLVEWFRRKFTHPTLREVIESSAPPPFDYASYYNSYLYVSTVGMGIGILQPIIFPITAFYLFVELLFKRYILQYIAITKTESGGSFWRAVVNRLLVANIICNAVIALIVGAQGIGAHDLISDEAANAGMLYTMIPLPLLVWAFKWYCSRSFDDRLRYYSTSGRLDAEAWDDTPLKRNKPYRVAVRFGHPALYKKLIIPMVDAKAEHLLNQTLSPHFHKRSMDRVTAASPMFGYSDIFMGEADDEKNFGTDQSAESQQRFEIVQEENMDFENFKRRAEFRDQFGGDGELYGIPEDLVSHSDAPSTLRTLTADVPKEIRRKAVNPKHGFTAGSSNSELDELQHTSRGSYEDVADLPTPPDLHIGRERTGSVDIDIPNPYLDSQEILAAASYPRHSK